jgi:hypothetical protein
MSVTSARASESCTMPAKAIIPNPPPMRHNASRRDNGGSAL